MRVGGGVAVGVADALMPGVNAVDVASAAPFRAPVTLVGSRRRAHHLVQAGAAATAAATAATFRRTPAAAGRHHCLRQGAPPAMGCPVLVHKSVKLPTCQTE